MSRLLVILSIILMAAVIGCQKQTADIPADTVVIDSVMSSDSVMIYYRAYGEGDRALVFVHGWSCDQTYWARQVETFKDEYRVVTLDLAGHGESGVDRDDWSVELFGDDVAAVVRALDLKEVALIGHSMGGPICIEAARRLPERVVVIIGVDTFQGMTEMPPEELIAGFVEPFRDDFVAATDQFVRGMFPPTADSELVEQVVSDMCNADPEVAVACFDKMFIYDAAAALKDMRKPIWAINCEVWPTNVEANRQAAASFDVILMTGVGHFLHLEDPATFHGHLRTILSKFWPAEPTA